MIIDGRAIAADIYSKIQKEVEHFEQAPVLAIVTCAPNFETKKYLDLKKKKAAAVGIETAVIELGDETETADARAAVMRAVGISDGVVVQLPFPQKVEMSAVLASIPASHDVDALNEDGAQVFSPVVAACKQILEKEDVDVAGKSAVVIGQGRLVGIPMAKWLRNEGAHVTIYSTKVSVEVAVLQSADIIVTGAGDPGSLKPDMVKDGVVILDAGTSEEGGELRGDADPACAEKSAVFTPVPGGVGPVTVAMLLKNVVTLAQRD